MTIRTQSWRRRFANLHTCLSPRPADHLLESVGSQSIGDESWQSGRPMNNPAALWTIRKMAVALRRLGFATMMCIVSSHSVSMWRGMRDARCATCNPACNACSLRWWVMDSCQRGDRRFIERWILYKYYITGSMWRWQKIHPTVDPVEVLDHKFNTIWGVLKNINSKINGSRYINFIHQIWYLTVLAIRSMISTQADICILRSSLISTRWYINIKCYFGWYANISTRYSRTLMVIPTKWYVLTYPQ
jgi:hypothetical protein